MIYHVVTLSLLIAAILLIRVVFRRSVSPAVIYALWLAVAIKLCFPFSFVHLNLPSIPADVDVITVESSASDYVPPYIPPSHQSAPSHEVTDLPEADTVLTDSELTVRDEAPAITSADTTAGEIPHKSPIPPHENKLDAKNVLYGIWIVGSIITATVFTTAYTLFTVRIHSDRRLISEINRTKIYVSKNAGSSCLAGFIPSIYLTPEAADSSCANLVISHEYTHFRHGDYIWSAVRTAAVCLFWWNPLVLAAAVLSKQDGEIACDHAVTKKLTNEDKIKYAKVIVDTVPKSPSYAIGFGGGSIKERIIMITKARKTTVIAAIFAVTAVILATGCSFIGIGENSPDFYDEISYDVGLYLKTKTGNMIIVAGTTPCSVGGDVSFEGLTDGDIVRFGVDVYLDSYPMQAEITSIQKIADGERSDIDEEVLNRLFEMGWIDAFTLPENFEEIYNEAEWAYSLFTGYCENDKLNYSGSLKHNGEMYDGVEIDGRINTLGELALLLLKYFDNDIADYLMSKTVFPENPLYIENDGKLYRFGGYVSQYSDTAEKKFIPMKFENGVYTVKVRANAIIDSSAVEAEILCSYILSESGEICFTEFPYAFEALLKERTPVYFTGDPTVFLPSEAKSLQIDCRSENGGRHLRGFVSDEADPVVYYGIGIDAERFAFVKCKFEAPAFKYVASELHSLEMSEDGSRGSAVVHYKNAAGEICEASYTLELDNIHEHREPNDGGIIYHTPIWTLTEVKLPGSEEPEEFDPDAFAPFLPLSSQEYLFWHRIFPSDANVYLYFTSVRTLNKDANAFTSEPPKDFRVYYTDDFGKTVTRIDAALPEDLRYDSVVPIFAGNGGGSMECVFYLKLTYGNEVFYVSFDNFDWGEGQSYLDFEYRGIVSEAELAKLRQTHLKYFGTPYTYDSGIYYIDDNRAFIPPEVNTMPSISPWGNDKMLYICKTYDKGPLVYYSRRVDENTTAAVKTEFDAPGFEYAYSTIIDLFYQSDYDAFMTVRYEKSNGAAYDVVYRGYAEMPVPDAEGKITMPFKWDFISKGEPLEMNVVRGRFSPTRHYGLVPDEDAEVLFHLKTMAYCYFFCTVGDDFAVYYYDFMKSDWGKLEVEIPEEFKYDSARPVYAHSGEYANGCTFYLEMTDNGNVYYLYSYEVPEVGRYVDIASEDLIKMIPDSAKNR